MKKTNHFRDARVALAAAIAVTVLAAAGCSSSSSDVTDPSSGSSGRGGSMARFTVSGDYMYTVGPSNLSVLSLADSSKPVDIDRINLYGGDIETIFTMDSLLFIGSKSAMYIYDISRPEFPKRLSVSSHIRSCDPVVAVDTLAFVTLNSSLGSWCGQSMNVLWVYNIRDLYSPVIICEVDLSSPRGLAVDAEQKIVFVCDNGLKAYDFSNPRSLRGLYTTASLPDVGRIDAYDCILWRGRLLIIGSDGLFQLSYDREGFTFISKIDLRPRQ